MPEDTQPVDPYGVTEGQVPEEFDDGDDEEVSEFNAGIQRAVYGVMGPAAAKESFDQLAALEQGLAKRRERITAAQLADIDASKAPSDAVRADAQENVQKAKDRLRH